MTNLNNLFLIFLAHGTYSYKFCITLTELWYHTTIRTGLTYRLNLSMIMRTFPHNSAVLTKQVHQLLKFHSPLILDLVRKASMEYTPSSYSSTPVKLPVASSTWQSNAVIVSIVPFC
jgi:hypothetical protein